MIPRGGCPIFGLSPTIVAKSRGVEPNPPWKSLITIKRSPSNAATPLVPNVHVQRPTNSGSLSSVYRYFPFETSQHDLILQNLDYVSFSGISGSEAAAPVMLTCEWLPGAK
jgi:hypothetical protein